MSKNEIKDKKPRKNPDTGKAYPKRDNKKILLRLSKYILRHKLLFVIAIIFTLIANQLSLLGPEYSGNALDAMDKEGGVDFAALWENVAMMIVCYALSAVLSYIMAFIMIRLSQKIVYSMRKEVFEKLNRLPISYFDTHPTGDIISRISYDIDTINSTLSHDLVQIMTSIYTVVASVIFMYRISKPMLVVVCITVPASIIFTRFRSKKVRPLFSTRSRKLGELNGFAEEMLSGTGAIRAYGKEGTVSGRFNVRNTDTMDAYYNAEYYGAALGPTVNFINNLSISLVTILGGILYMLSKSGAVLEGTLFFISLGGVGKFVQYSRKFAGPINEFANILHEFQSALSAAERVFKILDEPEEKADKQDASELCEVYGNVSFSDVRFGYAEEREILHGVSLKAKSGQKIAIVGPTGAGKTTIINLLMRFYDANSGEILVEGKEIKEIKRSSLRRAFTMVLQDTWLFHGTVFENIVYGKENASFDEVKAAARAARIDGYIESLPDGYNTVLSDGGINISKGQRQLITIARAMLSDAPMLILDEATSNVDSRTEIKIQEAMGELMAGRTSFIIAHRLSTVQNADIILVLENGYVTEAGSHEELLRRGGFYATLYNSQFK